MSVPRKALRPDFSTPRIIKGNWQIADDHSSSVRDDEEMYRHMAAFVDAGITAFDCGDIYYGVEERIGRFIERFRRERGAEEARRITVHTKYIPAFLQEEELRRQTRTKVEAVIDRSLRRLGQERLDLVQLHWWEYKIPGNVETALILKDLQKAGKIHHIAGTNYNVAELRKMIDAGVDIVANQVQFSVTDRRPQNGMVEYCRANNVHLLCYGAIGGGLFSRKWLGITDPGKPTFENVSLDKYYRIIVDFGGWDLFQQLLQVMDKIANKYRVSIATVASRYVLEQPSVAAVIQGARHARHLEENLKVFSFALDKEDYAALNSILSRSKGPRGDCYDLDREENRDAVENVATEYFDVENGALVVRNRPPVTIAEPYGHHLKT
jgi:aryl-alcohol dehydrogenase-like predicted oxidoreductase